MNHDSAIAPSPMAQQAPVVSILTPVFNEEVHLEQMLRSVINQTYEEWELILVDDGSTDRTVEIIRTWELTDNRIKMVSSGTKMGKVSAFNLAFARSKGQVICHVGGDDVLTPNSLQLRVEALAGADSSAVLLGKLQVIDVFGKQIGNPIPRGPNGSQSGPGATYTRPLAERIFPIPPSLPTEDIWLGNAAVGGASEVLHTSDVVVRYRVHPNNSNPRGKSFREMSEAIHARLLALPVLLEQAELQLPQEFRKTLEIRWELETLRHSGNLWSLATLTNAPLIDRVAHISMASPLLWRFRKRLGVRASGWRGR